MTIVSAIIMSITIMILIRIFIIKVPGLTASPKLNGWRGGSGNSIPDFRIAKKKRLVKSMNLLWLSLAEDCQS